MSRIFDPDYFDSAYFDTEDRANEVDHTASATARVLSQYARSPKLIAWVQLLAGEVDRIETCAQQMRKLTSIDDSEGDALDAIGEIVGAPRVMPDGVVLIDSQYRIFIRAKIWKNQSKGSNPEFLAALAFVFNDARLLFADHGGMEIEYAIGRSLTSDELAMLDYDILPRPMGVLVNRSTFIVDGFFGFDDQAGAQGFESEGEGDQPGGVIAEGF